MNHSFIALMTALAWPQANAALLTIPHPSAAIPPTQTVVWSPVFQATWDALTTHCGGQPKRIDPPSEIMTQLDAFQFDANPVLPEGSWKVWAGPATQEFLTQVNREAAELIQEPSGPFRMAGDRPQSAAAFGMLKHEIEFTRALHRSRTKPLEFKTAAGSSRVEFFGVAGELSRQFRQSIRMLHHTPEKNAHAVELECKGGKESAIFYAPPEEQDFATACGWIRVWKAEFKDDPSLEGAINDPRLHANDDLRVPYLSLSLHSEFPDLTKSLRYHGEDEVPWRIVATGQVTRFDLTEKGAQVKVSADLEAAPFGSPPVPSTVPRKIIYDRPFFVFLWRDQADWPYFAAWIGDASALKPFP
jgi:hypothetical protein